jgi:hypothetical protein
VLVRSIVSNAIVTPRQVTIELSTAKLAAALRREAPNHVNTTVTLNTQVRLTRTGRAVRLVHPNGRAGTSGTPDAALLRWRETRTSCARGFLEEGTVRSDNAMRTLHLVQLQSATENFIERGARDYDASRS